VTRYLTYIAVGALCLFIGYIAIDAIQTLAYDVMNIEGWGHTKP